MYFKSRSDAGKQLATLLEPKYKGKKCTIVALDDGGVMIGAYIAKQLKCALTLFITSPIELPRENDALAAVNPEGVMTYNPAYSLGEIDEMESEYRNLIDEKQMEGVREVNAVLGSGSLIRKDLLSGHVVIITSDGMKDSFLFDSAYDFLKPITIEKLVVAVPIASVKAIDRMHIIADDIICLSVVADYISTDHYYDTKDIPDHSRLIQIIKNSVSKWH